MDKTLFLNKYRPICLDDFEDQENRPLLCALLQMDNLNVLFFGDTGTGKTTFLNVLIREYYADIPPSQYSNNLLYIHSLKEQGINYYRNELKLFCQTCSVVPHKKKIVVLDDMDVINEQNQQAFRHCIDKYSHRVHFMASCSNLQKVIETLQSRLTIVKIKALKPMHLEAISAKIIREEGLTICPDAMAFILKVSNHSAKILINYMEKIKLIGLRTETEGAVDLDTATRLCTNLCFFTLEQYTEWLKQGELRQAILCFTQLFDQGYSVMDILDNYFLFVKVTDLLTETQKYAIIPILCKYIAIFHDIHEDEIELALFSNNVLSVL